MKPNLSISLSLSLFFLPLLLSAQPIIDFVSYATGFNKPVDIANAGDDRLFIVEQRGVIYILDGNAQRLSTPFLDIQSLVQDNRTERGLLGLVFHPDFKNNGYFYVNYTYFDTDVNLNGDTRISRFSVSAADSNMADPNSEYILLEMDQPYNNHNGGDLNFGPDGYLYIGTGDGGSAGDPGNRAQNTLDLSGKILRIDVDATTGTTNYGIPADNPFVGDPNVLDEIWAIGLRNPWRMSFDPLTGDLWMADVGQGDWEEVSVQFSSSTGGENYGWRCYEGNAAYRPTNCGTATSFVPPIYEYVNDRSTTGASITGGYVYRGSAYPGMYGYYIYGDYISGHVWVTKADSAAGFPTDYQPQSTDRAFSTFGIDANGELYAANLGAGIIYQVIDACNGLTTPVRFNDMDSTLLAPTGQPGYQWFVNGNAIPGAQFAIYKPDTSGAFTVQVTYPNGCAVMSDPYFLYGTGLEADLTTIASVSPNPFSESLFIQLDEQKRQPYQLYLIDVAGKVVWEQSGETNGKITLQAMDLPTGVYFLSLQLEKRYVMKLVGR